MKNINYADLSPEQEREIAAKLAALPTAAPDLFLGKPLWPFTLASRMMFHRVSNAGDVQYERDLLFVFVHLRRDPRATKFAVDAAPLRVLMESPVAFSAEFMDWLDTLPDGSAAAAREIRERRERIAEESDVEGRNPDASPKGEGDLHPATQASSASPSPSGSTKVQRTSAGSGPSGSSTTPTTSRSSKMAASASDATAPKSGNASRRKPLKKKRSR